MTDATVVLREYDVKLPLREARTMILCFACSQFYRYQHDAEVTEPRVLAPAVARNAECWRCTAHDGDAL